MDKNRSMVDVAYELMSKKKKAVNFYKLWQEVSEVKGFEEDEKDEREADCERSNTWLQKNPLRGGHNGLHLRVTIGTRNEGGATHEPDEKTVPRF